MIKGAWVFAVMLFASAASSPSQIISVPDNFTRLVAQEDTDGDKKITIHDYITPEGFGWTDASFEVGVNFLSADELKDLESLRPPD
jgi:Neutral trehalase Ca2+ binding domain